MINFYLDGVSFYYKSNPASQARAPTGRVWRKKSEGLIGCTTKGKKEGNGGKVVNILVAISYKKGAIDCEQYANMNGQFFKNYVHRRFPATFEKAAKGDSRLWIQDGDPSQNCAAVWNAFRDVNASLLSIPPRSPHMNPIETLFHLVRKELMIQTSNNITKETYNEFSQRVVSTINCITSKAIDKIVESMDKGMDLVIKQNGNRTKY